MTEITGKTPTLTAALHERGLTHTGSPTNLPKGRRLGLYAHAIYQGDELVFMGTAHETWGFLRELDMVAGAELLEVDVAAAGDVERRAA